MNQQQVNAVLMRLPKRAETVERAQLLQTFVDVGNLTALLNSLDHQVIYGRRGTGKTHALSYLAETRHAQGDVSIYIDMRVIGSTGGLYSDPKVPIAERATRLLRDTLAAVHEALFLYAVADDSVVNLGQVGNKLDQLIEAATQVVVEGAVSASQSSDHQQDTSTTLEFQAGVTQGGPGVGIAASASDSAGERVKEQISASGQIRHRVRFGPVGSALAAVAESLRPKRIWVLLDEWSIIPYELQPYLADLLRRSLFAVRGVTVKISAIERRTQFQIPGEHGDYLGIELGADASADLNLDDFMVFDNDASRSVVFFRQLLFRQYKVLEAGHVATPISNETAFAQILFTQRNALEELVRAAEGVPRDAMNIVGLCAQLAGANSISVDHVRRAAKIWYQRDKEEAVQAHRNSARLLNWIMEEVIGHRKARAFLLLAGTRDDLIERLFDARVLHLRKRNISSHDEPGKRYDVYKIDYGCYVDLLTSARAPQGMLPSDDPSHGYVEVPPDDYRGIRRAILDLEPFRAKLKGQAA